MNANKLNSVITNVIICVLLVLCNLIVSMSITLFVCHFGLARVSWLDHKNLMRRLFFVDAKDDVAEDTELAKAIMSRCFHPSALGPEIWEGYIFSGLEIRIKESTDVYGAVLWPSVCSSPCPQYSKKKYQEQQ